jgi:hypothetical protein
MTSSPEGIPCPREVPVHEAAARPPQHPPGPALLRRCRTHRHARLLGAGRRGYRCSCTKGPAAAPGRVSPTSATAGSSTPAIPTRPVRAAGMLPLRRQDHSPAVKTSACVICLPITPRSGWCKLADTPANCSPGSVSGTGRNQHFHSLSPLLLPTFKAPGFPGSRGGSRLSTKTGKPVRRGITFISLQMRACLPVPAQLTACQPALQRRGAGSELPFITRVST